MVMTSPRAMVRAPAVIVPAVHVDLQRARAGDAGPPHAARDDGGVAGHAAAHGEHAFGRVHAVDVFGRGFEAHQDDVAPIGGGALGFIGGEHDFARGRARRRGKTRGDQLLRSPRDRASDAATDRAPQDRRASPLRPSVISPSRTMSTAIFSAAFAVRLPLRVWSMKSLPSCTVNSTSCMSR